MFTVTSVTSRVDFAPGTSVPAAIGPHVGGFIEWPDSADDQTSCLKDLDDLAGGVPLRLALIV
jgi:hypothetical protein